MRLGVTYISSFLPHHMQHDLGELKSIGCDDVLFAIQENHLDTLQGAIKYGPRIAKDLGLRPQAVIWGFLNTFGGGTMSRFMLNDRSIWRQNRSGNSQPLACLNNPDVMRYLRISLEKLRVAGFESFFIDEPTAQDCVCWHCREAFARHHSGDLKDAAADTQRQFQRETVVDYIRRGCGVAKGIDRNIQTICCLMPCDRDCAAEASKVKDLDMLSTDPYWLLPFMKLTLEDAIAETKYVRDLCRAQGKQSQVWLNCWAIPAGTEEGIYSGGKELASVGCDSLFTWSYRAALGTNEECPQPEIAWSYLVRLYKELSGTR